MQHVAIDLGGKESQVCVRAADGQILHESKIATLRLPQFLRRQAPSRVILESCAEAFRIATLRRNASTRSASCRRP